MFPLHSLSFALQFEMAHPRFITSDFLLQKCVFLISAWLKMPHTRYLCLSSCFFFNNTFASILYALTCIPCYHGQLSNLIEYWHHVSWLFRHSNTCHVPYYGICTFSIALVVCCWLSRSFFTQQIFQQFESC
jgi:hypothetical protein